ncbi:MAG: carboxymuconolactone decarboxylase family protein, partial [Xanthobacteraceae bacterium]
MSVTASRISPLDPPYAPDVRESFDAIMKGRAPLVLFRTIATSARAWAKFRDGSLLDRGPLSLRDREIVIDRTTARTNCEYEWGVHVAIYASSAGLTDEQINATRNASSSAACWIEKERALIAAVDALHDRATLDQAEFDRLRLHYD